MAASPDRLPPHAHAMQAAAPLQGSNHNHALHAAKRLA